MVEEWKWMGSPTWSHNGLIAVANAHKEKVKVTFSQAYTYQIITSFSMPALRAISGEQLTSTRTTA
jgi:hypothetical protein